MTTFILPLQTVPQTFNINLANKPYLMTVKWNDADDAGWVADFADGNTNVAIVGNIPLITGADCLSGLEYLEFDGSLLVYTDGDSFAVPTLDNLGVEANLYFLTDVAS